MSIDLLDLYKKYDKELRPLSRRLRTQYHRMHVDGCITAISDVEGELLYMLVREAQPELAFEISPAYGWSTNYMLAALTMNQKGTLHSFEINQRIRGKAAEQVIRDNQHPDWDRSRLVVHIGDARKTVSDVAGPVGFLFLDSCHEDWFARWYIEALWPRIQGPVMLQDIAFADRLERSSEAGHVWAWFHDQRMSSTLIGAAELALEKTGMRTGYAERSHMRSNSIVFSLPPVRGGAPLSLAHSPEELIEQAQQALKRGDSDSADSLLNQAVQELRHNNSPQRANRHRLFFNAGLCYSSLGETGERARCFHQALVSAQQEEPPARAKGLSEMVALFSSANPREWRLTAHAGLLLLLVPGQWMSPGRKIQVLARGLRHLLLK